jgi:hypothetical protein
VKLSVTLISGGRYIRAGEDIPDDQVTAEMARYAVEHSDDSHPGGGRGAHDDGGQETDRTHKPHKPARSPLRWGAR